MLGLEVGADDYVTKPLFLPGDGLARAGAAAQDAVGEGRPHRAPLRQADDLPKRASRRGGRKDAQSSPKEYDILCKLMEKPNWVVTREQLLSSDLGRRI